MPEIKLGTLGWFPFSFFFLPTTWAMTQIQCLHNSTVSGGLSFFDRAGETPAALFSCSWNLPLHQWGPGPWTTGFTLANWYALLVEPPLNPVYLFVCLFIHLEVQCCKDGESARVASLLPCHVEIQVGAQLPTHRRKLWSFGAVVTFTLCLSIYKFKTNKQFQCSNHCTTS